jgi:DNA repair photolyase
MPGPVITSASDKMRTNRLMSLIWSQPDAYVNDRRGVVDRLLTDGFAAGRQLFFRDAQRALTPTGGFLRDFAFSLNPYIGCAFGGGGGCPYCYVRALPVARAVEQPWGSWVIAKRNLADLIERELASLAAKGRLEDTAIFMSSATDPYQGFERHLRLTRAALEAMVATPPRRLVIQTRSPLVERDIDLIKQLGVRVIVSLTLETDDDAVRKAITRTSPSVARRVECARRLRNEGIFVQIAVAPMLPNRPERFASMVAQVADRVVVDTLLDGDGAGGARSRALGMEAFYARLGYPQWLEAGSETALLDAMRARLGTERVAFSRDGFNDV